MMKWKKFSTAPKDGSIFTVWLSDLYREQHFIRFSRELRIFQEYSFDYDCWVDFDNFHQATHWMQIEPPNSREEMTDHSLLRCCGNCGAAALDERTAWCEYLPVGHPITHCCDYHEWAWLTRHESNP